MLKRSHVKHIKTTITGIVILGASIAYLLLSEAPDPWVFGIALIMGISLLFLPDSLIGAVKNFLSNNKYIKGQDFEK
ncbi:MAG: hypothetical protein ACWA5P_01875 [bacterium]